MSEELRSPWLVAVWPGMGGVAQIAGSFLAKQLGAEPVEALDASPYFEASAVSVREGRLGAAALPTSVFYAWRNPGGGRDLLVLVAEQQPAHGASRYARALLEIAKRRGVERVFTFAAMASPIQPGGAPRVFAATTHAEHLGELAVDGAELLSEGEISGLNGVFLAAAAEAGLPGTCLLGEFPFFAGNLPNPRASAAVLRVFSKLAGVAVETRELVDDAEKIEAALREQLERVQGAVAETGAAEEPGETEEPAGGESETGAEPEIPPATAARIEELFQHAAQDRSKALELKRELDRRGLFRRYEDRFLDLFRKAG